MPATDEKTKQLYENQLQPRKLSNLQMADQVSRALLQFAPISLAEMDSVKLMNRLDKKYMLTLPLLNQALPTLQPYYRVLTIDSQQLNHYRTLYFDSDDFTLYNLHVNGRANRYKVRSREYIDSKLSFLEVKHKTPKNRTIKQRIQTNAPVKAIQNCPVNWLSKVFPLDYALLEPTLLNSFTRVTLVNTQVCERVTLDLNLCFSANNQTIFWDGIVIAEVKLDSQQQTSKFMEAMRKLKIHPQGCSKYCLGVSMLYDHVKKNAMKSKLISMRKLITGG